MCNLQVFKHNILVQKMTNVYSTLKCVQQNTNVAQQDEIFKNIDQRLLIRLHRHYVHARLLGV